MDLAAEWGEIVISWANWLITYTKNREIASKSSRQQYEYSPATTWRDYQGMFVHARRENPLLKCRGAGGRLFADQLSDRRLKKGEIS